MQHNPPDDLDVYIVTGASRGIGLAIVKHLLHLNVNVLAVARWRGGLEEVQRLVPQRLEFLGLDVAEDDAGTRAVEAAERRWGRVNGLVVNHGVLEPVERVADADLGQWRHAFDVTFFSAVALVKAAIPHLRATRGRIVLCSSGAATKGTAAWGCYGAAKASLNHLAMTLAKEEEYITTIAIRPGVVDTQMQTSMAELHHGKMDNEDAARFKKLKSEGKMLRPEQPGNVMAQLVHEAPRELTGQYLSWDDITLKDHSKNYVCRDDCVYTNACVREDRTLTQ